MDRRVSIDAHSIAAVRCPPIEWNQLVRCEGNRMTNGHGRPTEDDMIEILKDFPDNVVAAAAHGVVTKQDYQHTLIPQVELTLKRYPKIRCYYNLGPQFSEMEPGAMWEDFKIGVEHISRWERVAIVTDVEWIRHATNVFRFLMPGEVRVFATSETASAREWITAVPG